MTAKTRMGSSSMNLLVVSFIWNKKLGKIQHTQRMIKQTSQPNYRNLK